MDKKQFIYKIKPARSQMLTDGPTTKESEIVSQHFNYLKDLSDMGIVLLAGRTLNTDETSFGIVIFLAENEDAARMIVQNDPAVANGMMNSELYPYRVALVGDFGAIT